MNHLLDDIIFDNYIVAGISAGPDSMCLLHLLKQKTDKIVVCHINHNVRKQSKKEEEYLRNYCEKNNIIFESMKIEKYEENNFENEARKKRYAFYEKTLKKYDSHMLFLAHHGDDLIETVLMKIIRGSNIEGYSGIKKISNVKDYQIIRPLLPYTKKDIIEYNRKHNIKYFTDSSNKDIHYTRNRYRKKILPLLKEEDKNVHLKFLKYSNILDEYDKYIKSLIKKNINNIYKNNIIYLDELNKLDDFLRRNTMYYIMNNIYDNKSNTISDKLIDNILNIINNSKPNQTLNIPKNKILVKEYNKLYIKENIEDKKKYKLKFEDSIKIDSYIFTKTDKEELDNNSICRLNSKNIKLPLYFRNRKDGDYIQLKGSNNKKKLKEIFIEKKLPIKERNNYPLLVDSNDNILWIPNIKKSNFCIKKGENNQNYDIIIKCEERKENNE